MRNAFTNLYDSIFRSKRICFRLRSIFRLLNDLTTFIYKLRESINNIRLNNGYRNLNRILLLFKRITSLPKDNIMLLNSVNCSFLLLDDRTI